jgi:hypothetical protein
VANSRARATTGWSAAAGSSPLHACDELAKDLARQGVDLTLLHADRVISLLAARQDAIVTWQQLGALGIGRGVIARRVQRGMLRALHVGVYL